jgi:hypothetical protein
MAPDRIDGLRSHLRSAPGNDAASAANNVSKNAEHKS